MYIITTKILICRIYEKKNKTKQMRYKKKHKEKMHHNLLLYIFLEIFCKYTFCVWLMSDEKRQIVINSIEIIR